MLAKDAGFEDYDHATDVSVAAFEVARPNRLEDVSMFIRMKPTDILYKGEFDVNHPIDKSRGISEKNR